jgi:hypothetical protein
MLTRQTFLRAGVGLTGASLALPLIQACSPMTSETYPDAVQRIWHPASVVPADQAALQRELVRYATLAPSGHNTQCWKFRVEPGSISILPDFTRRTPVVDPDDHHLFVSLGCALENMAQASLANGLKSLPQFDAAKDILTVKLDPTAAMKSPLFDALTDRQCTRGPYDGRPLSSTELNTLELAGTGNGVRVVLFTDNPEIEKLLELVLEGNTAQVTDPAFIKELKHWLRFGASEAVQAGDGLYSATSGNPSVPRWVGSPMFDMMFSAKSENDKYAAQVRSSAGIAVFVSEVNDKAHWIEAGRCYERFALQATAIGVRNAMLNQAVEVPAQRQQLADYLGLKNGRPDLVVRFGRGAKMPQSLRRRIEDVLI